VIENPYYSQEGQRGDVSRMTGSAMAVCAVRGITSDLFVNQFINR
jgi:hypothetical protein